MGQDVYFSLHTVRKRQFSKTCVNDRSKKQQLGFQDQLSLNAGQTYCRMLQGGGGILRYFRPSLSYQLSFGYLFCLFLSGRFTHVLLYNSAQTDTRMQIQLKQEQALLAYVCHSNMIDKAHRKLSHTNPHIQREQKQVDRRTGVDSLVGT